MKNNFIWIPITAIIGIVIITIVGIISASSFGSLCSKAFPTDGYKQIICVERMAAGKSIEGIK
jgi:hypothetical protein